MAKIKKGDSIPKRHKNKLKLNKNLAKIEQLILDKNNADDSDKSASDSESAETDPLNVDENFKNNKNALKDDKIYHECPFCSKQIKRKSAIERHTNNHLNFILTCKICQKHFKQKGDLERHKVIHLKNAEFSTTKENPAKETEIAEIEIIKSEEIRLQDFEKNLRCTFCFKQFAGKGDLDEHTKRHRSKEKELQQHKDIQLIIKCEADGSTEKLTETDEQDTEIINSEDPLKIDNIHQDSRISIDLKRTEGSLRCKYCSMPFTENGELEEHTKKHLDFTLTCEICGKHWKKAIYLEHHKRIHSVKKSVDESQSKSKVVREKVDCTLCGKRFSRMDFLALHTKKHLDYRLTCKICLKHFQKKQHLESHKGKHMQKHSGESSVKCKICDATFKRQGLLNHHIKIKHVHGKNIACDGCDKKYRTRSALYTHKRRIHSTVKRYKCEPCDISYFSKIELTNHNMKHHGDYDKRRYQCTMCDKKFVEIMQFKQHMNTHTGEKPYKCDVCSKAFGWAQGLRVHKNLHTGRKHYCKFCGKGFSQPAGVNTHIKKYHARVYPQTTSSVT